MVSRYPKATKEDIEKLKTIEKRATVALVPRIVKDIPRFVKPDEQPKPAPEVQKEIAKEVDSSYAKRLFRGEIANVDITREPLAIDNPVQLLLMLKPEMKPYRWQFEMLMQMAGYLTPGDYKNKTDITAHQPLKITLPAANGSGKDEILIATFSVWLVLTSPRSRVIITSSSQEQAKFQTEVHIRDLVKRVNAKFGQLFKFNFFHYIVPELGSEIKLFATDEEGRAEGYHPYHNGKMALILNEAKTIREPLFDAIDRCTGYSHLFYISSPGFKRGRFYRSACSAIEHPSPAVLGKFYYRRVTAFECPHIPRAHIDAMIYEKGENSPWVRSSIFAEFSDFDEPIIIPDYLWQRCIETPVMETGNDIGIGLDLSGGGDETYCFVREGNHIVHSFGFRQKNSGMVASFVDEQLSPWKATDYVFRADNGGIGQAIIDQIVSRGWRVRRTNNQSPAYKKSEFLNLGAEMYFYVRRLIERRDIVLPVNNPLLREQLTTRQFKGEESTQGKFALQSKKEARAEGLASPDRADSFVLCFSSYRPRIPVDKKPEDNGPRSYTVQELLQLERRGLLFQRRALPMNTSRFTTLVKI